MVAKVFIDGEAGTTGLQIRQRLEGRRDLELVAIDPALRKDAAVRRDLLNAADVVDPVPARRRGKGGCGPDRKSASPGCIDASTAHRTAPVWTLVFPK